MTVAREDCEKHTKVMTEKIDKLKDKLVGFEIGITKTLAEMPKNLADEFDGRYADKKTEKTVDKVVWLVLSAFVISILGFILK